MKEYKIVTQSHALIESAVNNHMGLGWELHGSPCVYFIPPEVPDAMEGIWVMQAMTRELN